MSGISAISLQKEILLQNIRSSFPGEWKVLILDEESKNLLDGVAQEDDILEANVTNIEQIRDKRSANAETDALYILSPRSYIVECLLADVQRRRYRRSHIIWISGPSHEQSDRMEHSFRTQKDVVQSKILNLAFYPRESHLITLRDPWSFPMLFHPACNQLVRQHMDDLAQKIVAICVSLGEYPTIRYHNPQNPSHEASVLCSHLARFVQLELDHYAKCHNDFPPLSTRPRGSLIIIDRSIDLFAPIIHEFTYQAMVHDLLSLSDGDRTFYKVRDANGDTRNVEISEKDSIWVVNRHLHMKDLIDKLVTDFEKFRAKNPQFAEDKQPSSLNNIKDMLAGLPQYQEGKEAYSLHLGMAQEAVNIFQKCRLADVAAVEQSLGTGLDEENKKAKNMADQVVRLLDADDITPSDRLRLIIEYLLFRDGLLPTDIEKLLAHAQLPAQDGEVIYNLDLLGAHVSRGLRDTRPLAQPLFPRKQQVQTGVEEVSLSRFEPVMKSVLEEHIRGTLDQSIFPFTKPHLDSTEGLNNQDGVSQGSLRSAKPTWARTRSSPAEPKQRIIIFMAGGATYSESRACYEISESFYKDVFLATSHMLTPSLYLRQVRDLSVDRRRLNLPADQPPPRPPAHLFENDPPPPPHPPQDPPTAAVAGLNINSNPARTSNYAASASVAALPTSSSSASPSARLPKDRRDAEKKKKHHFFRPKK